jgi:hypothetical protein
MANDRLDQMRDSAERIYLNETNAYVNALKTESLYHVISQIPIIHQQPCYIKLNEAGQMEMRVKEMKGTAEDPPANYQHIGYGFHREFLLMRPGLGFKIPFGVGNLRITFNGTDTFNGLFHEMESAFSAQPAYFRCILPLGGGNTPSTFLETATFSTGPGFRAAGLFKINIADCQLRIFDYKLDDNKERLFIDAIVPCAYALFKKAVDAFLIHYGWISGNLIRERMLILIAADAHITQIKHFSFYKLDESKSGLAAIRPRDIIDFIKKEDLQERYLNSKILSDLIERSLIDDAFLRAATVISESHGYPMEIRASTYSVALETLKNIIIEQNQDKINPVKNKSTARNLAKVMKETVVQHSQEDDFNNRELYLQRIDQLNQVGNTDSFLKAFELMGLQLNDKDKDCLKKRNDFLHGRIPFDSQPNEYVNTELATVVMRLHLLLCALLLKMVGYNGHVFNNLRYRFLELEDEPIYRNLADPQKDLYVPKQQ